MACPRLMASSRTLALSVFCLALVLGSASTGGVLRGGGGPERTVDAHKVASSLQEALQAVLRGGEGAATLRLDAIELSVWRTFQALPKNSMGRLTPRSVRYLAHNYFAKEHGWIIKGLEPHGMQQNMSEVHEVSILQDKAPALVEGLLESRHADHGLSLAEVVAMIASLERLIFDESITLLEAAYTLNGFSTADEIAEDALHEVLQSYLLLFEMGSRANLTDARRHQATKKKVAKAGGSWPTLVEFEKDAASNFAFAHRDRANPFAVPEYTFQAASQIVESLAQSYGKWQNTECRQMKEVLMDLSVDGSGRVPLSTFYAQPQTADYQFTESIEYLRQIGALDESAGQSPRVRIANYMAGPSNCIASSSYYSVCCLSDCEALMNELEGTLQAPMASPERLLRVVRNMSSHSVDAPRQLSGDLEAKMQAIAAQNGGEVPLHGRLFAQWLHHAFPNECPYPLISGSAAALAPEQWQNKSKTTASAEERRSHVEAAASVEPEADAPSLPWHDEEVLILREPPRGRGPLAGAMRVAMQLAMFGVVVRTAYAGLRSAAGASSDGKNGKDRRDLSLPF